MNTTSNGQFYKVGYCGGSGGFIFFHFLLLSEQYYANFRDYSINKAIDHQWNIKNTSQWKHTEIWPSNFDTVGTANDLSKVLYFCNPSMSEFENTKHNLFITFKQSYDNIKDSLWPNIDSFDDFIALPKSIKTEMLTVSGTHNILDFYQTKYKLFKIWLYTDFNSQNELAWHKKANFYIDSKTEKIQNFENYTTVWENQLVDQKAVYFLKNSDMQIKLQHWVNEPDMLIDHQLIDKVNQKQYNLLNHWKKLHPSELLQKIGIK